jgi:hypothetical protein
MTTTTTTCDRCGALITTDLVRLMAVVGVVPGAPVPTATGRSTIDLCGERAGEVEEWLQGAREGGQGRVAAAVGYVEDAVTRSCCRAKNRVSERQKRTNTSAPFWFTKKLEIARV